MPIGATEIALALGALATGALLLWPRLSRSRIWRATITPLASIIGSGFLILGPILTDGFGSWSLGAMALLCLAGYLFGGAIRYNIARLADDSTPDTAGAVRMEGMASWALAFAYVVSVAYYLNLFGAFAARIFGAPSETLARTITTGIYALILAAGLTRGFGLLERMEQVTVSIKLVIIAALIAALCAHAGVAIDGAGLKTSAMTLDPLPAVQLLFGLVVTVQGFETSRYLGDHYSPEERCRSMRLSQWIASGIYMAYVALLAVTFTSGSFALEETAIIDMMAGVSAVLGPLLILAALSAQFSAAVADTNGSGGLVRELTGAKVSDKASYALLVATGLALTWLADVFQIVAYASRAFAFYYAVQALLAALRARHAPGKARRTERVLGFYALTALGLAAAIFGTSVEG